MLQWYFCCYYSNLLILRWNGLYISLHNIHIIVASPLCFYASVNHIAMWLFFLFIKELDHFIRNIWHSSFSVWCCLTFLFQLMLLTDVLGRMRGVTVSVLFAAGGSGWVHGILNDWNAAQMSVAAATQTTNPMIKPLRHIQN